MKPQDIKLEFFRSGGPGGQHKNKRRTSVRAVHVSTGIAAVSQRRRSQAQNKEEAFDLLRRRLLEKDKKRRARVLTHKSAGAREKILEDKRRRAVKKRLRLKAFDHEF